MPKIASSVLFASLALACQAPRVSEVAPIAAAPRRAALLTFDDLVQLPAKLAPDTNFAGWLPDTESYLAVQTDAASKERRLFVFDASTGERRPFTDPDALAKALAAAPDVAAADAKRWAERTNFDWSADRSAFVLNEKNDLFHCRLGAASAVRLTNDEREEVGEKLSPDGKWLGYVADFNLHVVPADGSAPARALTTGGDEDHLHGRLDWVYQEEVYGRGNFGAYWWSPDSRRIAYLVIDESKVPTYVVTDHRTTHPKNEEWRYPKAGDPNPVATLHIVDVASGASTAVALDAWNRSEYLIVRVGWTPDSSRVIFQMQDRVQTWLDLAEADPATGAARTLLRDRTETWIEPDDGPYWIEDGSKFLWRSERDGWAHLYLYDRGGKELARLTQGEWEVDAFVQYDEAKGLAYFMADQGDVKGAQLYRCKLDGSALERVTKEDGRHTISMSDGARLFLDTFVSAREYPRLSLRDTDGRVVREIERVDGSIAAKKGVQPPEFFRVPTRDGFAMEAMMIKPANYEPGKRYPVLCHTYSGPQAPQVLDRPLAGGDALFHSMLAQQGYLVWICDNRSASGKGLASARGVHRRLGVQELADLEDGVDWLVREGFADPERIGIWGWSYGGYQTAFALTHSKKWKCGIVGAPVTDWRLYDSIYTERFMGLPQENEAGYKASSVLEAAANLHGRALILHGVIDENVHMQNSLQLAEKLQRAGIPFDLMVYPGNRHGIRDPAQNRHKYLTMAAFLHANL